MKNPLKSIARHIAWKLMPYAEMNIRTASKVTFPIRNKNGKQVFTELYMEDCYGGLLSLIPVPNSLVDLGCNCGYFPLIIENIRRNQGLPSLQKILMIDADPSCVRLSQEAVRMNKLEDIAQVQQGLIGPLGEKLQFNVSRSSMRSSLFNKYSRNHTLQLQALDLDVLVRKTFTHEFDLLKIDIEGAEKFLADNIPQTLSYAKAIIIEWHECAGPWSRIVTDLEKFGHKLIRIERENVHQHIALLSR